MTRGNGPGGVGESLRTLFGVGTLSGLTDGQLLERFARGRGAAGTAEAEAAFAALVERHGLMVLGVCRAVLGDRHDAEDACQAAFLVLARSAGQIRRGDSMASWLYGVARRVALRARRQTARRRELERRRLAGIKAEEPASSPPAEPCPELYEELDRLPQPFRAAVVLCDLEGHSYEQAASLLRCPVGTIQSRLARGRQRLRRRLERRGFSSAIAAIGTAAGLTAPSASAAMPPQLAATIARAATGMVGGQAISGTVAALAGAEMRRLIMTRILMNSTVLALTGLAATALIAMAIVGRGDDPNPRAAAVPQKIDPAPIHVRVVDARGDGAPGIAIEIRPWDQPRRIVLADDQGRAVIPRDAIGDGATLIAKLRRESLAWAAPGYGNPNTPAATRADPIIMRLLPLTHRVEGTVVDERGKPIAGVKIQLRSLPYPSDGTVHFGSGELNQWVPPAVTDDAGRFVKILPEGVAAGLSASHPRYIGPGLGLQADSRILEPMVLEPAGGMTGTVTDAAGRPVAGAAVSAELIEHHVRILGGGDEAVSDEQGRYVLGGLEPGVYNLVLSRVPGRPEATARAVEGLRVRAGADTPADLTVIEGRPLRGVVIDREDDRPVAGIRVGCYGPAYPTSAARVDSRKTDDRGRFTFHVPPGEQHVYIMDGISSSRLSRRDLVVPERGEIEPIRLMRNKPRSNAMMGMMKMMGAAPPIGPPTTVAQAEAVLPTGPMVSLKAMEEKARANAPKDRTVTGHVRDPEGRPLPAVQVQASLPPGPVPEFQQFDIAATDREGMFLLPRLPRRPLQLSLNRGGFQYQVEPLPPDRDRVELTYRLSPEARPRSQPVPLQDEPMPPGLRARLTFVDLGRLGNDLLVDGPGQGDNNLDPLPRGVHKLGDAYYRIGESMVHVQGRHRPELPQSIKGIPVQARGDQLHILHGTQWTAEPGTLIGAYVVHYADGSTERIPIAYGRSLVNWWRFAREAEEPVEARVAWTGLNNACDLNPGLEVRLFTITWTNSHPEKAITSIDVLSAGKECDPFLLGLTLSRH